MAPVNAVKKTGRKAPGGRKKKSGCGCREASESSSTDSSNESSSYTSSSDYTTSSSESESDSSDGFECPFTSSKKRGGKKVQAARQAKLVNKRKPTKRRTKHSTSYGSSDYDSSDDSFRCCRKPGRKCRA
ncbi:uncharacterized protein LOC135163598 [Diachasmimorpha longicaudata]|uniref:uncharacterized protein LOC135163598 n=1 Tax=Diachasmimorpha longicaudata TaxID=58733 RepID=UPI0030B8D762